MSSSIKSQKAHDNEIDAGNIKMSLQDKLVHVAF